MFLWSFKTVDRYVYYIPSVCSVHFCIIVQKGNGNVLRCLVFLLSFCVWVVLVCVRVHVCVCVCRGGWWEGGGCACGVVCVCEREKKKET